MAKTCGHLSERFLLAHNQALVMVDWTRAGPSDCPNEKVKKNKSSHKKGPH